MSRPPAPKPIFEPASPDGSVRPTAEARAFYQQFRELVPSLCFARRPAQQGRRQICYVLSRGRHRVVPQVSESAAPPLTAAVVDRTCAPAADGARAVSLSLLQLARVAQG